MPGTCSGVHGQQNRRIFDADTLDTWEPSGTLSTDEVWGTPFGGKSPPESGYLPLQVCGSTEDSAGGGSLDAEPILRGEERNLNIREKMREANGGIEV